jgi:hypothetical protein
MNRRRRNTTKILTPRAVVNAVMADLRAEGQSALIRWLSNEDHRFVMEQYAKGLLSPAAPARGNRRGRRRSNPIRKVVYSGG